MALEAILLGEDGRKVVQANIIVIRDLATRIPVALVKSVGDGIVYLTAEEGEAFEKELRQSVFPSDLETAEETEFAKRIVKLG